MKNDFVQFSRLCGYRRGLFRDVVNIIPFVKPVKHFTLRLWKQLRFERQLKSETVPGKIVLVKWCELVCVGGEFGKDSAQFIK